MQKDYSNEIILVKAINQKDPGAWDYIRKEYFGVVRFRLGKLGASEEDAKDFFSEGLEVLINKTINKKLVMKAKVRTLLIKICENRWKAALKDKSKHERHAHKLKPEIETKPEEKIEWIVYLDVARKCFLQLEELCQKIITMMDEKKSQKEIGELLGLKAGYIAKRHHYCQKEWRKLVETHPGYLSPEDYNMDDVN